MTEEQKELLKEKLKQLLDEKLNTLTTKFENDINTIEIYKYFCEIEKKDEYLFII